MQIVKLEVEDSIYNDMLKSGINIQEEVNKVLKKTIYHKEHKIANDIVIGLEEIKQGKSRPIKDLFSEL
ncbi:hypothetical protein ALC152_09670 [Arcobacter sp. 15-2]|uniref:hypothetical protein n=1 Tax=Arcobacter sp. 15-2 TaxID=3374109 RepID=UPI00399C606A